MPRLIGKVPDFTVTGKVKDMFFDRARVINTIRAEDRRRLSKIGAYVRQRARTDVLKRPPKSKRSLFPPSAPGSPPHVHSNDSFATLRNILFALNSDWESVIIGPRGVPSLKLSGASRPTVPALMEFGGKATITETLLNGEWVPGNRTTGDAETAETRKRRVSYPKRPFMSVALQREVAAGTIPDIWKRRSGGG